VGQHDKHVQKMAAQHSKTLSELDKETGMHPSPVGLPMEPAGLIQRGVRYMTVSVFVNAHAFVCLCVCLCLSLYVRVRVGMDGASVSVSLSLSVYAARLTKEVSERETELADTVADLQALEAEAADADAHTAASSRRIQDIQQELDQVRRSNMFTRVLARGLSVSVCVSVCM
jgi:type IV secretory pathway VirB3-like protein